MVLRRVVELEFQDLQFVTTATTNAELHFNDVVSLDSAAEFMYIQVHIDICGAMRRNAGGTDGLDFFVLAEENHAERTFLVSPALVHPLHVEFEDLARTSSHEFPLRKEIVARFGKVLTKLVRNRDLLYLLLFFNCQSLIIKTIFIEITFTLFLR